MAKVRAEYKIIIDGEIASLPPDDAGKNMLLTNEIPKIIEEKLNGKILGELNVSTTPVRISVD